LVVGIPLIQKRRVGSYIIKKIAGGETRFPLVLMLEPLFRCNLACPGCGKIDHPEEILQRHLSVEECLEAAEECGAPVVSVPGGEPLLHPEIDEIVRGLADRKRFVYLCTNALLLERELHRFEPSPYLNFNIHLDGMGAQHDRRVGREGAFAQVVEAVRTARSRGFRLTTNTTLYRRQSAGEISAFFDFLMDLGVEGMTVSPGFGYEGAPDQDEFLDRRASEALFREILRLGRGRGWRFNHSLCYMDFLAGNRQYRCAPWGTPTYNIFGWQRPCYLLNEGYAGSYREFVEETDWDRYGHGIHPGCLDCMVHCGYEPPAVLDTLRHPLRALLLSIKGIRT
jgi:hopanoid biosynthesis associated radical SAM protein HpnH